MQYLPQQFRIFRVHNFFTLKHSWHMKKIFQTILLVTVLSLTFVACKKELKEQPVSSETINQIKALGLNTDGVKPVDGGWLVEGDIVVTPADLTAHPTSPDLTIAQEEQYRTFNLLSASRHPVVKIALNSSSAAHDAVFTAAIDEAIKRYNAENLTFSMQRVTSGQDITVVAFYEVSNTLGSSGFPNSSGDPYNQVRMNTYWYSTSTDATNVNYIGTIVAHELGHCVGFRHTDYMSRRYSCGSGGNEGQAKNGVGAVLIPGTPSGPDAGSWMLACIGSNVNRPFNSNDKIALSYLW
jgi:hypothetical protein